MARLSISTPAYRDTYSNSPLRCPSVRLPPRHVRVTSTFPYAISLPSTPRKHLRLGHEATVSFTSTYTIRRRGRKRDRNSFRLPTPDVTTAMASGLQVTIPRQSVFPSSSLTTTAVIHLVEPISGRTTQRDLRLSDRQMSLA